MPEASEQLGCVIYETKLGHIWLHVVVSNVSQLKPAVSVPKNEVSARTRDLPLSRSVIWQRGHARMSLPGSLRSIRCNPLCNLDLRYIRGALWKLSAGWPAKSSSTHSGRSRFFFGVRRFVRSDSDGFDASLLVQFTGS
jgi:hypothetical protein